MRTPGLGLSRRSSTSGVLPIAWTMSPYLPPHGLLSRRGSITFKKCSAAGFIQRLPHSVQRVHDAEEVSPAVEVHRHQVRQLFAPPPALPHAREQRLVGVHPLRVR